MRTQNPFACRFFGDCRTSCEASLADIDYQDLQALLKPLIAEAFPSSQRVEIWQKLCAAFEAEQAAARRCSTLRDLRRNLTGLSGRRIDKWRREFCGTSQIVISRGLTARLGNSAAVAVKLAPVWRC